ncbi:MAG: nicotinate phosphoribosyltransferase [Anaerolineaceae bacterium]|nr:nicotinate phosphoribosyltransferase [Anaerolineaceae bacterium]
MTVFDGGRLTQATVHLDIERLRRGYYSDKYFENAVRILAALRDDGYTFAGHSPRSLPVDLGSIPLGDLVVEAQIFNRRAPRALVAGVDMALAMLRHASGHYDGEQFVETWRDLEVEAVADGVFTSYGGNPEAIQPVLKIRGHYRDFGLLETALLGVLTRASRMATNVYQVLGVANGKQVLFFPARFDLPGVQPVDGYAYWLAVQRHNLDTGQNLTPLASTDAQGAWWGGSGGGTVPHALIACFLADTAETMIAFARYLPPSVPRIALVDFNNDTVRASLDVLRVYWPHYRAAYEAGDVAEQRRWTLYGVRLDTSTNTRDASLKADDPTGVNPVLVRVVRAALDDAWGGWDVPEHLREVAQSYCRGVKIVVSGGFDLERIQRYEEQDVPVDIYGVGSTFLRNDSATGTDYTMDIVRVQLNGQWVDMAKVGRKPCDNPDLRPVDLENL